jgi:hypothetical protein
MAGTGRLLAAMSSDPPNFCEQARNRIRTSWQASAVGPVTTPSLRFKASLGRHNKRQDGRPVTFASRVPQA